MLVGLAYTSTHILLYSFICKLKSRDSNKIIISYEHSKFDLIIYIYIYIYILYIYYIYIYYIYRERERVIMTEYTYKNVSTTIYIFKIITRKNNNL